MRNPAVTTIDFAEGTDFSQLLANPILDIAARLWDDERYEAFRLCYRSMRVVDDLVDDARSGGRLGPDVRDELDNRIDGWIDGFRRGNHSDRFQRQLLDVMDRFAIPVWPWERLAKAMIYDLHHDGYQTFHVFLRYCEGAAIAPAAVFVHLCGLSEKHRTVLPPSYDIRSVARPLALFSYLTHIMRDFQKDQRQGLNYFTDDLLVKNSLDRSDLRAVAEGGEIPPSFRHLMADYHRLADYYRRLARSVLNSQAGGLPPRYRLSLELIYNLYLQVFERISPENGRFTSEELSPDRSEVEERIKLTLAQGQSSQ